MATYRQVHISFWQDPYIEDLSAKEKYFYIYLMTNSKTKQCGCYEISMKLIKYETALTQQEIDAFITKLSIGNKIRYNPENQEFLILNWLKHNSFKSPKVLACIIKELQDIKTEEFKQYIYNFSNGNTSIDSLSIVYRESIDTQSQKEEEKEEKEKKKNMQSDFDEIYTMFARSGGKQDAFNSYVKLLKDYTHEQLVECVKQFNTTDKSKGEYAYQANNFFGKKAYYKDYLPKPKLTKSIDQLTIDDVPSSFQHWERDKDVSVEDYNRVKLSMYKRSLMDDN